MEPWKTLVVAAGVFLVTTLIAHLLRVKKRTSRVIPSGHHTEHHMLTISEFPEKTRPYAFLIPVGASLLILGILVITGYLDIGVDRVTVALFSMSLGSSLLAFGIFKVEVDVAEYVTLETTKSYLSNRQITLREKINLSSGLTVLENVNRLFFRLRAKCNTDFVVAQFITVFASNLYLKAVNFWIDFLQRFRETTYSIIVWPIEGARINSRNKELLLRYIDVVKETGAIIPVELRRFVGTPEEMHRRFRDYVSRPISVFSTANLLYGDHIKKKVSKQFLYLCYACLKVSDPSNVKDVFEKALSAPLADFDPSAVKRAIYLPAASEQEYADYVRWEAEEHEKVLKERFKGVETEVLDELVLEGEKPNLVFATIILVCDRSKQFEKFKESMGGEKE